MKKIFILIIILFFSMPVYAIKYECPVDNSNESTEETLFNKITGYGFASKLIAETIIEKELDDELDSKINATLDIYNIKRLKQGEFKSLKLTGRKLRYKTLSLSNFQANTLCTYNKVIYKKTRVHYPYELPFTYRAKITNEDIQNAITSEGFINFLKENPIKINKIAIIEIKNPTAEIKNGRIYFNIPLNSVLGSTNFKFNSTIGIKDNTLILRDINIDSLGIGIKNKHFGQLADKINPFKYEFNTLNSKYCKIYITNARISDNIIETEGVFIINKNYDGVK